MARKAGQIDSGVFFRSTPYSREVWRQQNHIDFRVSLCDFYSNRSMIKKPGPNGTTLTAFLCEST
jgi:hypothetical protein